jgi:chaperonin GroES
MSFRPLHDRVLVRRIESDTRTAGGIIIPDTAKEKPQEGVVVSAGPGARDEAGKLVPLDVKAGDHILFGKWSGTEVKLNGEELIIMKESDILGLIEKSADAPKAVKAAKPAKPAPAPKAAKAAPAVKVAPKAAKPAKAAPAAEKRGRGRPKKK